MHVQECTLLSWISSVDGGHQMNKGGMECSTTQELIIHQLMIGQVWYLGPTNDITEVRYISNRNMNESVPAGKKT